MSVMPRSRPPYPPEFRREAVQLVLGGRSVKDVAGALGCSEQSLHNWVKQYQLDSRERQDGLTSAEREELRELRKRVKRVFCYLDHFTWWRIVSWLRKRHLGLNWGTISRRYPPGWEIRDGRVEMFRPQAETVSRYRYRGNLIPTPWTETA
jgi:hypothetical protein